MILHPLVKTHIPLADKNWFKTGGVASWYAEPSTEYQLQELLQFSSENKLSLFVLGEGANTLISDEGFKGLVIHPRMNTISIELPNDETALITAQAGALLDEVINYCLDHNCIGLEVFSNIPGTIGGALYINVHYFEFLISMFLSHARVIEKKSGEIITVTPEWFSFGYNASILQKEEHYLVDATFKLARSKTTDETAFARGRREEIIRHRTRRYPQEATCGSFFRNFFIHELPKHEKKSIASIAYYLDAAGVKGTGSGNAQVSSQHANMIVNMGGASSDDIVAVAKLMQKKVYTAFKLIPQPECKLIGFNPYPLMEIL